MGKHRTAFVAAILACSVAAPALATTAYVKEDRAGKVFLDWSQNSGSKTTVSPYSLRGRERPTVATPLTWAVVMSRMSAQACTPAGLTRPSTLLDGLEGADVYFAHSFAAQPTDEGVTIATVDHDGPVVAAVEQAIGRA